MRLFPSQAEQTAQFKLDGWIAQCKGKDARIAELVEALEVAQHRLDALRSYVPAHMLAAYLLDKDEITNATRSQGEQPK